MAIAVVDDKEILWMEGFGYTETSRQTPITPSTIFSVQSISKSFTATAVMLAVQDGLVDLDEPITTYLPNFTVHSIFEEHPERKMTLRILLSHTAGFPLDAWYGGNFDHPAVFSFEKHIASISDTWLMFPVGTRYSYSNEGIDLAGYILQVRSGVPFTQYVQEKVLNPLGMKDTTLDVNKVRGTSTRAIGDPNQPIRPRVDFLFIPSGGVWTSAEDMARYLQFHINKGAFDGNRFLKADLAETIYTPPNLATRDVYSGTGYALGVEVSTRNGARILYHGGGGFGFDNHIAWYPELKLGIVVLANAIPQDAYPFNLSIDVLDKIIANNPSLYKERLASTPHVTPAYPLDTNTKVLTDSALRDLIATKALPEDAASEQEAAQKRRSTYAGTYVISDTGFPSDTFVISDLNGLLIWTYDGDEEQFSKTCILTEVQPGLLLSESGNTFSLRGPAPMVDNIRLVKINPRILPFKITLYGLCGLVVLSVLFFWPVWLLIHRVRRKRDTAISSSTVSSRNGWFTAAGILAVLTSFFSLFCLLLIAIYPNLVYFPWPLPYIDMTWWQFTLVGMPFINLALGFSVALIAGYALRRHTVDPFVRWYYFAVGLAFLTFNMTILL